MTITEFLLARIAEDEAAAMAAAQSDPSKQGNYMDEGPAGAKWLAVDGMVSGMSGDLWDCEGSGTLCTSPEVAEHFALHDPARVLAECAAKRTIIGMQEAAYSVRSIDDVAMAYNDGECDALDRTVRALAIVYQDHPDYDPEWAA